MTFFDIFDLYLSYYDKIISRSAKASGKGVIEVKLLRHSFSARGRPFVCGGVGILELKPSSLAIATIAKIKIVLTCTIQYLSP